MKQQTNKNNRTNKEKSCFFEKISKIHKTLTNRIKNQLKRRHKGKTNKLGIMLMYGKTNTILKVISL